MKLVSYLNDGHEQLGNSHEGLFLHMDRPASGLPNSMNMSCNIGMNTFPWLQVEKYDSGRKDLHGQGHPSGNVALDLPGSLPIQLQGWICFPPTRCCCPPEPKGRNDPGIRPVPQYFTSPIIIAYRDRVRYFVCRIILKN